MAQVFEFNRDENQEDEVTKVMEFEADEFGGMISDNHNESSTQQENGIHFGVLVEEQKEHEFLKGILVGIAAGLSAGAVAWYFERNKRKKLLQEIERVNLITAAIARGTNKYTFSKQEVEIAEELMENPIRVSEVIRENINNVRMSKKEKQKWIDELEKLVTNVEITAAQQITDNMDFSKIAYEHVKKAMEEVEKNTVEILEEESEEK